MDKVGTFNVAVAVVIENGDKILITKRSATREHDPNVWEAGITGRVDQNETCEEAAVREVKEEVGLEVELVCPFNTFHFYRGKEKIEHQGVNFWSKYKGGEIVLDLNEQSEFKWVTPEEALSYMTNPNVVKEVKAFIEFKKHFLPKLPKKGVDYIGVAVGAMVFNDKGELFLSKRSQNAKNECGCWEVPGGGVDIGETLQDATKREFLEEYGVEIELIEQFPAANHIIPDEHQHWVPTTFLAKVKDDQEPAIMEPDKCDGIGWFALDKLPQPLSIITKIDLDYYMNTLKRD